jgi:hypothetical protein
MDFSYKGFDKLDKNKVYYNLPPRKAVVDQCIDTFNGIMDYLKVSKIKLLEIYPFLGINPVNYEIERYRNLSGDIHMEKIDFLDHHFYFIYKTKTLVHFRSFETDIKHKSTKDELLKVLKSGDNGQIQINDLLDDPKDSKKIIELIREVETLYSYGRNNKQEPRKVIRDDGWFKQNMLVKMLFKYFGKYNRPTLKEFRDNNQIFSENEKVQKATSYKDIGCFYYSGIKVYPPLGFRPWPEEENNDDPDFIKTNLLYQYCTNKGIPMTTHCSDGGFKVIAEDMETDKDISSPENWKIVLENYNDLKLNFAHFGNQASYTDKRWGEWTDVILAYISGNQFPNVYADLSDIGVEKGRYKKLVNRINKYWDENKKEMTISHEKYNEKIETHILFGTDFMMNLFHMRSNLEYLQIFDKSKAFQSKMTGKTNLDKTMMCSTNPQRFLFRK